MMQCERPSKRVLMFIVQHRVFKGPQKRIFMLPILLILLLVAFAVSPALAQELGDADRGRAYAEQVCASCHAVLPTQSISPKPGIATFKVIANTPGMTALALAVWLQTPHRNMPNFVLAPDNMDDVIAYIVSLQDKR